MKNKTVNERYPIVEVVWNDAMTSGAWGKSRQQSLCECLTVGMLTHKSKHVLTIAQSLSEIGNHSDLIGIPRSQVVRIRRIGRVSKSMEHDK